MIDRLAAAILTSGESLSSISETAKLGRNYASQMLSNETTPKSEALVALCTTLGIDSQWAMTGTPANPKLDGILELSSALDFESKKEVFKAMAPGSAQSLDSLHHISQSFGIPLSSLQGWIEKDAAPAESPSADAFEELSNLANGQEIDIQLMRESLQEAYEIEIQVLGKLGPVQKRSRLVREIYALKLAHANKQNS